MYKQVETAESVTLTNCEKATPVASLRDEHGAESHFIIDDGCYVLVNVNHHFDDLGQMSAWIYPEAFEVLRKLPPL